MSVVDVKEQSHLRSGSSPYNSPGDAVRVFLVRCDNKHDDDGVVLFTSFVGDDGSRIPVRREPHPTRSYLLLANKAARQSDDKGGFCWEVTCTYQYLLPFFYPWDEPAKKSWDFSPGDVLLERDIATGKGVCNSAGQPFDPAVTVTRYDAALNVTKNLLSFDASIAAYYGGTVNESTFYGSPQDYCMCVPPKGTSEIYIDELGNRTEYWIVTYQFLFRNTAIGISWQPKKLDAGFCKLESGKHIPITVGGREPSSPVPLDGSGMPLDPPTDTPTFLDFRGYPRTNFSALGV